MSQTLETTVKLSNILIHRTFTLSVDKWDYVINFQCPSCSVLWRSSWYSSMNPRPAELMLSCHNCDGRYRMILDWEE